MLLTSLLPIELARWLEVSALSSCRPHFSGGVAENVFRVVNHNVRDVFFLLRSGGGGSGPVNSVEELCPKARSNFNCKKRGEMITMRLLLVACLNGWRAFGGKKCIATQSGNTSSASSSPAPDCSAALVLVADCLQFVTRQSNVPSKSCCSGVMQVHLSTPACICEFAEDDETTSAIPNYQPALAAQLPSLCNMGDTVNASSCPALLGQTFQNATNTTTAGGASAPVNKPTSDCLGSRGLFWDSLRSSTAIVLICAEALATCVYLGHYN